ncbi:MAG: BrnA antitoxin family protein [Pseudomonadota bacterium]|nr:BrnA antitoxin family protein [Pseudomonadota bacterium]
MRPRGRPPAASAKVSLSVRYSPEVVDYFRATREGGRRAWARLYGSMW